MIVVFKQHTGYKDPATEQITTVEMQLELHNKFHETPHYTTTCTATKGDHLRKCYAVGGVWASWVMAEV